MQVRAPNHSSNSGCAAAIEKQVFDKGGACQSQCAIGQQPAIMSHPFETQFIMCSSFSTFADERLIPKTCFNRPLLVIS